MRLTNEQKKRIREIVWYNSDAQIEDTQVVSPNDDEYETDAEFDALHKAMCAYAYKVNRRVLNKGDATSYPYISS